MNRSKQNWVEEEYLEVLEIHKHNGRKSTLIYSFNGFLIITGFHAMMNILRNHEGCLAIVGRGKVRRGKTSNDLRIVRHGDRSPDAMPRDQPGTGYIKWCNNSNRHSLRLGKLVENVHYKWWMSSGTRAPETGRWRPGEMGLWGRDKWE